MNLYMYVHTCTFILTACMYVCMYVHVCMYVQCIPIQFDRLDGHVAMECIYTVHCHYYSREIREEDRLISFQIAVEGPDEAVRLNQEKRHPRIRKSLKSLIACVCSM